MKTIEEIVKEIENNPVEKGGHIYHPIPFPEFSHLKTSSSREEALKKWGLIERRLNKIFPDGMAGRKALDVGANAGFYTYTLAKIGAEVTAFEPHPRYSKIGGVIAREKGLNIKWNPEAFSADSLSEDDYFDFALMLSVFQWISEGNDKLDYACETLKKLSSKSDMLFFELGVNTGASAVKAACLNKIGFIYRLLKENTDYQHVALVGTTNIWPSVKYDDSFARRTVLLIRDRLIKHKPSGKRFLFLCSKEKVNIREPWFSFVKYLNI
ncbi:MAG TPA: methyltransferase domain-containing protein [bacterium]|nr:methyltransferase domain-containing protein [bacterium]HPN93122.1 methyltransferase domain-containing protein [bacterium]